MASILEIEEERLKVRRFQFTMDLISNALMQSSLKAEEMEELVSNARQFAMSLFSDKELAFEIIYAARFRRIIAERFKLV